MKNIGGNYINNIKEIVMKQFNLMEHLANPSRKIVTRDGRNVRIICTDKKGTNFPIVALVECEDKEETCYYNKKGYWNSCGAVSKIDLFFAPEKHEGWIIINKYPDGVRDTNGIIYHTKSDIPDMEPVGVKRVATIKIEWEEQI